MATRTDPELVDGIRHGASDAEAALYERFGARVFYLALRTVRVREDAEDVRAETFVRVLQSIRAGRLRNPEALPGFLVETARNVIRERARRLARVTPLDDSHETLPALSVAAVEHDPYAVRAIEETIEDMNPRERLFLRLYYYEDLPKDEIARRLGIKEERLRLIKSRTLKRFRERYERLTRR